MAVIKNTWQAGFTLLEMLVVIAIIALLAGVVTLSVSGTSSRRTQEEAERLQQALQMAADEAIFQGVQMGVYVTQSSYGFLRYDTTAHRWQSLTDRAFRNYDLPEPLHLTLRFVSKPVTLPASIPKEGLPPSLVFLSSGEMTPFYLSIFQEKGDVPVVVETDGISPIALIQGVHP